MFLYKLSQLAEARLDACVMQASARHCSSPCLQASVHTELGGTIYEHIHSLLLRALRVQVGRYCCAGHGGCVGNERRSLLQCCPQSSQKDRPVDTYKCSDHVMQGFITLSALRDMDNGYLCRRTLMGERC